MPAATIDLILTGGQVRTLDPDRPAATAVALSGNRIAAVGEDDDVRDWRGTDTEIVDLHGATVLPGLVDSHIHPVLGINLADSLDLNAATTLADVLQALSEHAARLAPDAWVEAWGLDPNAFGGHPLEAAAIDEAVGGRPALVKLFDGHSALASSTALALANIHGARRFASAAVIVTRDDGTPTGHLLEEDAVNLVDDLVPPAPFDVRVDRLAELLQQMAATGLTGGHVMDCSGDSLALLAALEEQNRLPLRLRLAPWFRPGDVGPGGLDTVTELQTRSGRRWKVAGAKLFMDGSIDGGTAWLHEPDCLGDSTHANWLDPQQYTAAISSLHAAGIPTATHAIGDAAVEHVLNSLAALSTGPIGPTALGVRGVRHRVEHIETLPDDQIRRFAELGVVASMQPTHATDYTRADHSDNWSRRLGPVRAARAWRCADILRAGAILALGSDWPVAPFDPRAVMAAARLRRPANRPDLEPVAPAQALTAIEALTGYTVGPAYAAGAEDTTGRIKAGYVADLSILAADPVKVTAEELPDVPVTHTVVDGQLYAHATNR